MVELGIAAAQNCSSRKGAGGPGGLSLPGWGRPSPGRCPPPCKDEVRGISSFCDFCVSKLERWTEHCRGSESISERGYIVPGSPKPTGPSGTGVESLEFSRVGGLAERPHDCLTASAFRQE